MSETNDPALKDYYEAAESWADTQAAQRERSLRIAWFVAAGAGAIALLEALALVLLIPLKKTEPYAVLVDRQTGHVQGLDLAEGKTIKPDQALLHSMLAQYVAAREGFNITSLNEDYRKVALWSAGDTRSQYVSSMQASNPRSPLATLPRTSIVTAEIQSISALSDDSALVRFSTTRADPGAVPVPQGSWAAVIRYRFSTAQMSAESRLTNPLGFQVISYTRTAEIPQASPAPGAPIGGPIASGAAQPPLQQQPQPQSPAAGSSPRPAPSPSPSMAESQKGRTP